MTWVVLFIVAVVFQVLAILAGGVFGVAVNDPEANDNVRGLALLSSVAFAVLALIVALCV